MFVYHNIRKLTINYTLKNKRLEKDTIMLDKILPKTFLNKTKVEPVQHPFVAKNPYGRNNVAYYLLNVELGERRIDAFYDQHAQLFSVQYDMYQKLKPNVTFVINFFNKEGFKDLLDIENEACVCGDDENILGRTLFPFNKSDRCRYLIPSIVHQEKREKYRLSKNFNFAHMLFLNILNNQDLGYSAVIKNFLLDFFNLKELKNKEFNNFNELHKILSQMEKENATIMLEFINKYKDILFFEKENCKIFSVKYLSEKNADINVNGVTIEQNTKSSSDINYSNLFWGNDFMSLYYQDDYSYFFNSDSNDVLFNSFIQELIRITAQYINTRQLPRYENNVLYCLYNCDNKHFIQSLLLDEESWVNKHVDILSIHYIDNKPNMDNLKNIMHEHILPRNIERIITTENNQKHTKERLNIFLGVTNSFIMYPLLNMTFLNDYVKQIEYIYNELSSCQYEKYHIQYILNDFKSETLTYQHLLENQSNLTIGTMLCFDLGGKGLMQYKMNYHKYQFINQ